MAEEAVRETRRHIRRVEEVNINDLRYHDTVIHEGKEISLSRHNLKFGGFTTIKGDSYRLGMLPVKVVLFPKFYKGQYVGHVRQP